jgi:ketosteroid isomerase-like protein
MIISLHPQEGKSHGSSSHPQLEEMREPMSNALPDTPTAAVEAWWQATQNQDLNALERLTAEDYVAGGPTGRTTSRDQFLAHASTFFGDTARIEVWSLSDLIVRDLGAAAVCTYDWAERGQHAGQSFELAGAATDVLVRRGTSWMHQARHISAGARAMPIQRSGSRR